MLNQNSKLSEDQLNEKHNQEMAELLNILETELPKTLQFSKELIYLRQEENGLVKDQK